MTRVGGDFRNHGQDPATALDDANVDSFALGAADLDTTISGTGALTLETGGAQAVDPDGSSLAFIEGITALSVATSGKFRAMLYYAKCPTAGAGGGYRAWILRNAANTGDVARLMVDSSRKFWLTNGSGTTMAGGSFTGIGADVPVRVDISGDFSAGTARIALYTTDPTTSTTPDQVDAPTGLTWVSTDMGRQRLLAPHSGEAWTTAPILGYWDSDDTSEAAMTPLPPNISGTAASTLPALTQAAAGTVSPPAFTGTSANTLPTITQSAAGDITSPSVTGTATSSLGALNQDAAGVTTSPGATGTAASTLGALSQTATGAAAPPAFIAAVLTTLAALTQTATGAVVPPGIAGSATTTLGALGQAATGTSAPPIVTGTIASTLAALTQRALYYPVVRNPRATLTPNLATATLTPNLAGAEL